jgi:hypothetical protein
MSPDNAKRNVEILHNSFTIVLSVLISPFLDSSWWEWGEVAQEWKEKNALSLWL